MVLAFIKISNILQGNWKFGVLFICWSQNWCPPPPQEQSRLFHFWNLVQLNFGAFPQPPWFYCAISLALSVLLHSELLCYEILGFCWTILVFTAIHQWNSFIMNFVLEHPPPPRQCDKLAVRPTLNISILCVLLLFGVWLLLAMLGIP